MDPNWAWFLVSLLAFCTEAWALAMRHDRLAPATFWLRKLPWLVRAGVIGWLIQHFLFCGPAC